MAAGKLTVASQPIKRTAKPGDIEVPAGVSRYVLPDHGEFIFHLRVPDSQLLVESIVEARADAAPKLVTRIVHHAARTQAETLVRTLSADQAQPHYSGMIEIMPNASGCESYLSHHSLLIDPRARSWSVPSLEIKNNEVKCSHSATLHTITDADLFYLRSRGLSRQAARQLVIEAFLV